GLRGVPQSSTRLMRFAMRRRIHPLFQLTGGLLAGVLALALGALVVPALAQPPATDAAKVAEVGPRWSELTPVQRNSLKPLERDWSTIDADRKQKWIEISGRMPGMPPAERERVQARMTEWARLSPSQRG